MCGDILHLENRISCIQQIGFFFNVSKMRLSFVIFSLNIEVECAVVNSLNIFCSFFS